MPYKHICAHHANLISRDRELAKKYWSMFIQRGRSAFSDCRWEGATVYLGAAIDVAAVRLFVRDENEFNFAHILEPLDMICKIHAVEQQYNLGQDKIAYVRDILCEIAEPSFVGCLLSKFTHYVNANSGGHTRESVPNQAQLVH